MPTPDFVLALRRVVGHDPLWLPGVCGVVLDDAGRVLLGRRADTGAWALITGMVEPGEEPAVALRREVEEETGVVVEVECLLGTRVVGPITFPNGDVVTFLNLDFRCRWVSGTARVNDDESLEVGWYAMDELPPMPPHQLERLRAARAHSGPPRFVV